MTTTQEMCFAGESSECKQDSREVFTPEGILPEGVDASISINPYTGESGPARKGTVAATLNNIPLLNKLLSEEDSPKSRAKIQKVSDAIIALIPSLRVIGVFDMFSILEWLSAEVQPGRILVGVLYLQRYPQEMRLEIRERLMEIQKQMASKVLSEAVGKVLASDFI